MKPVPRPVEIEQRILDLFCDPPVTEPGFSVPGIESRLYALAPLARGFVIRHLVQFDLPAL